MINSTGYQAQQVKFGAISANDLAEGARFVINGQHCQKSLHGAEAIASNVIKHDGGKVSADINLADGKQTCWGTTEIWRGPLSPDDKLHYLDLKA